MRKHIKKIFIFLAVTLLICLYPNRNAVSGSAPEPAFSLNATEIVLISEATIKEEELELIQNAPYDFDIIEHIDEYLLVSVKDMMLNDSLSYLRSLPFISIAELNCDMNLNFISDSFQYTYHQLPVSQTRIKNPSKEVVIAILDTGIDYMHPDLAKYMWINQGEINNSGMDDDENGYIDDIYGWDFYNDSPEVFHYIVDSNGKYIADPEDNDNHGTHCAGIIAKFAEEHDVNIKIMALKIHGGKDGKGSISNAIKAIKYASMMGADICNMSWGTTVYSEALEQVMRESGMLFVTAAGNEGKNLDEFPLYPACFDLNNMIVTTFTDTEGKLTPESNYSANYVDIALPGINVKSTIVGSYGIMSGSSMSAPYAAAAAALLYENEETIYPSNVKSVLTGSLTPSSDLHGYVKRPGMLSIDLLISNKNKLKTDSTPPTLDIETFYSQETLLLELTPEDYSGSGIRVIKYASGTKQLADFKGGVAGTSARSNSLALSKAGPYTFYISDYAGNESLYHYTVEDDDSAPEIDSTYKMSSNKNIYTVTAQIQDNQSGIKLVKYMKGEKDIADFRSSTKGTVVESKDGYHYSFTVESAGRYSIYAIDYRGNATVQVIDLPTTSVESFNVTGYGQILTVGSQSHLECVFTPYGSTDTVTFKSSKPSVASVNNKGMVKAISPGFTTITAKTSQGLTSQFIVFVTQNRM